MSGKYEPYHRGRTVDAVPGDISRNVAQHLQLGTFAAERGAPVVCFSRSTLSTIRLVGAEYQLLTTLTESRFCRSIAPGAINLLRSTGWMGLLIGARTPPITLVKGRFPGQDSGGTPRE